MLRKLIQVSVILTLVAGPASAQVSFSPFAAPQKPRATQEEIDKQNATDNAYHAAIQKIPEKKVNDPWGNIRDSSPTASKANPGK